MLILSCECCVFTAKPKQLKPEMFVKGVVGLFVGFPQRHRISDGYARCLLCRVDLSIADRGIHTLFDHWKSANHTKKEQKYRLMTGRPLLNRACRPVSEEERERIASQLAHEPPVYKESPLGVDLAERLAMEADEEAAAERREVTGSQGERLWLAAFVDGLVTRSSFRELLAWMDRWASTLAVELSLNCPALTYSGCQVTILHVSFICYMFLGRLHVGSYFLVYMYYLVCVCG